MKRSVIWKMFTTEELMKIVKASNTFKDILLAFGLTNIGGNCKTLKTRLIEDGIDYSHIPQGVYASRGRCNFRLDPLKSEVVLVENSKHSRNTAKRCLLREKLLSYGCSKCGLDDRWQNENITLVLDHKNGIRNDHRLENLRFLCPNCNSQTKTFGGRNIKREKRKCIDCGKNIIHTSKSGLCYKCAGKLNRVVDRPTKEELSEMVWEIPTQQLANRFGISDSTISKWCRAYGIKKPGPGYWAKKRSLAAIKVWSPEGP